MQYSWHHTSASSQHALGIDIADGSLELANVVEGRDGNLSLKEHERSILPRSAIVHGLIRDERAVSTALTELITKAQFKPENLHVITALPDAQVLTKILPVEGMPDKPSYEYLNSVIPAIYKQMRYTVKNPVIQWKYTAGGRGKGAIALFVTSTTYIQQWQRFFKRHNLDLVAVEMESLAVARALVQHCDEGEHIGIIDFGFRQTNLSVINHDGLAYSHAIDRGGEQLSVLIAQHTGLPLAQAETLKKEVGLHEDKNPAVARLSLDYLSETMGLVNKSFLQYAQKLTRVIITGGGSLVWGIRAITRHEFKVLVNRGKLWIGQGTQKNVSLGNPVLTPKNQQFYAGAVGLAIRGATRKHLWDGISFIQ